MFKKTLAAGVFALALVATACSSNDEPAKTASSVASAAVSAASSAAPSSPAASSPSSEAPASESPEATPDPILSTPQPEQDDDPGGHPCTDQSGAPGHLIADNGGVGPGWVCEITGDAPQVDVDRHAGHDDDPGGHPCTDQSGAPGFLIADNDGKGPGWICEITGDAPLVN